MTRTKQRDSAAWHKRLATGRVQVQGDFRIGRRGDIVPRFLIVTPEGVSHEFACGYLGRRIPCGSNYTLLDGAIGEVWYHPIFGALQWRFAIGQGKFKGRD